jgi:3-hydroxyisobutyrate dehydrogenase-like beta-hydroxyacid dehydrogenase
MLTRGAHVSQVGLINPGAMGTPIGIAAQLTGACVKWVSTGRSKESVERAGEAGFEPLTTTAEMVACCDLIITVCPPHAAAKVADEVASHGFEGVYVDANAISPEAVRAVGGRVTKAGGVFVDGSIIGGPPTKPGTTRLYLSGVEAERVQNAFCGGHFDVVVLSEQVGEASALKMAYAAWTKGSDALLLAIRGLARGEGVEQALLDEWAQSLPGLAEKSTSAVDGSAPKAWRFVGEMEQIAQTFETAHLPDGFHRAAAEVYRRLESFKNQTAPELDSVLLALTNSEDKNRP